ncbi:hypothetical protein LJB92_03135, partial [Bacteroidales bacterium OttesenSCG-928-M06]|nr:hypothetical protein [Bacteroidales bacterium OttesenSCG-928-M06]
MKKIMTFFLFFLPLSVYSQFEDNFSDGSFYDSGRQTVWLGDVSEFFVNDYNELQLNSDITYNPVQLRTKSSLNKNVSWYCSLVLDFTPSSSNYCKIFLISDNDDLCGETNGLFLRIGYTDKNICLIQSQEGKKNKTLIKGITKRLDKDIVFLEVKATLNIRGELLLYSKLYGEEDFTLEGSCQLSEFPIGEWFGIVCHFTKTRSDLFYFEEFIVEKLDKTIEETSTEENPEVSKNKFTLEYPYLGNECYRINYQLKKPDYCCKLVIYDISGRLVSQVLNNQVLETNGSILLEDHTRLPSGIYILFVEI